jgi:hypothetical protein
MDLPARREGSTKSSAGLQSSEGAHLVLCMPLEVLDIDSIDAQEVRMLCKIQIGRLEVLSERRELELAGRRGARVQLGPFGCRLVFSDG